MGMQGSPNSSVTDLASVNTQLLALCIIILHCDACIYSLKVSVLSITTVSIINPHSLILLFIFALTFHKHVLANFPSFGVRLA